MVRLAGPVSRLRGNERTILISADAREGGDPCLDVCLQRVARFKHGFPSSREAGALIFRLEIDCRCFLVQLSRSVVILTAQDVFNQYKVRE